MMLTSYYKFVKGMGKTRFDETASTKDYPEFEVSRNKQGSLSINYTNASYGKESFKKIQSYKINNSKGDHLSSVYFSPNNPFVAEGDIKNTQDKLLFIFNTNFTEIEIFVSIGKKRDHIFPLLCSGQLNRELAMLRDKASSFAQAI